jgi:hypothetical protein
MEPATASPWNEEELGKISTADDLHISLLHEDGVTVVAEGGLYARAYNGTKSSWYRAALRQKAGRVTIAGLTRDVILETVDGRSTRQPISRAHDWRQAA